MIGYGHRNIASMIANSGEWVDVFYNPESGECYQNCKADKWQKSTADGYVLLGTFSELWDAKVYLEEEFGSNVELN